MTDDLDDLLPPSPFRRTPRTGGRSFNTSTPLGQLIKRRGLRAAEVAHLAGFSERKMTNLLNGTQRVKPVDAVYLAKVLGCTPSDITGSAGPRSAP